MGVWGHQKSQFENMLCRPLLGATWPEIARHHLADHIAAGMGPPVLAAVNSLKVRSNANSLEPLMAFGPKARKAISHLFFA